MNSRRRQRVIAINIIAGALARFSEKTKVDIRWAASGKPICLELTHGDGNHLGTEKFGRPYRYQIAITKSNGVRLASTRRW